MRPGGTAITEDREALLTHYRRMREDLLAAIDGLSDEQMTETSLDGWSVKDHLAHIAFWDELRAGEVARISAGNESVWRTTGEQDNVLNDLAYDVRRNLPLPQVRWELETTLRSLLDAITSATPRGLDGSLYGEAGLLSHHGTEHSGWIRRWRAEKSL